MPRCRSLRSARGRVLNSACRNPLVKSLKGCILWDMEVENE